MGPWDINSDLLYPIASPSMWDTPIPIQSGYDPLLSAASAVLTSVPYITKNEVSAKLGSEIYLIEATDDTGSGELGSIFDDVIANVPNEVNGYLSAVYPLPLIRIGTPTIVQVSTVDATGAVTAITVLQAGFYQTAPATPNTSTYPITPAWLDQNHLSTEGVNSYSTLQPWMINAQAGIGLQLTLNMVASNQQGLSGFSCSGTPAIAAAGSGYSANNVQLLYGGSSFLPPKVRYGSLVLACDALFRRRLASDEKANPFEKQADAVRKEFADIAAGNSPLDANFRRLFSPAAAWVIPNRVNFNSL
jgi:hypothetical protein